MIALYGKPNFNSVNERISDLLDHIDKAGYAVEVYERYYTYLRANQYITREYPAFTRESAQIDRYSLLISVGGDGTLLDTVTLIGNSGVPVVGINAGRLGFISALELDEIGTLLRALKAGTARTEDRLMLDIRTDRGLFGKHNFALNEVTILKRDTSSMIRIDAWIDNEFLNTYWADGLIVSTPTGSTAYSLSCSGPIIMPKSESLVITPIAPHNLNVRPVVVSANSTVKLVAQGRADKFLMAADSRSELLRPGEEVILSKASFSVKILQHDGSSFLNTLRTKLGWGLDKRN